MSDLPSRPPAPGLTTIREPMRPSRGPGDPHQPDGALQTSPGPLINATGGLSFDGMKMCDGSGICYYPPDNNIAVGPNHIVEVANAGYAVYDKAGNTLLSPRSLGSIWAANPPINSTSTACSGNSGDTVVRYDRLADRWMITQLGSLSAPYYQCIAVSTTNDPVTTTYKTYVYAFGSTLNDYPKFGVWPTATNSAYLATYNLFYASSGAEICAYDRAKMLAGTANPAGLCFTGVTGWSYLPSDLDGPTPPLDGTPGYFIDLYGSSLGVYTISPNFTSNTATLSSFSTIPVAGYSSAPSSPQPGTTRTLDALSDRLMNRLAYRVFSGHESIVVNHSVVGTSGASGVRWYELQRSPVSTSGAFSMFQQGTYSPDTNYRWMGSAAMDQAGDIAIGYDESNSTTVYPSVYYTGRIPSDAAGTMETEAAIVVGTGSQTGASRWGDYSSLVIDPSDDCTFWYVNEYYPTTASVSWHTRIGSFKFDTCGGPPPPPPPPPTAPDNLHTTKVIYNEVDLAWNDNSNNEDGFHILRCTGAGCTPTTTIATVGANITWYYDTSVSGSTDYVYMVQAYNAGGTSNPNPTLSVTTPAPPAPNPPSDLTVTGVMKAWISLKWTDNSNNETNFDVERCKGVGCTNFAPLTSTGANLTTYKNTGLARHTTYQYRVKARNSGGSSVPSNMASGTTN